MTPLMTPLDHISRLRSTADAMEQCANNDNEIPVGMALECCDFRDPRWVKSTLNNGEIGRIAGLFYQGNYYRLVEIPKPTLVPLDAGDVLTNKTILKKASWISGAEWGVVSKDNEGVAAQPPSQNPPHYLRFDTLKAIDWLYSNDHGKTWAKAEKPSQS